MNRYVTFTIGDGLYGVDVLRVQEALRAHARTRVPLAPSGIAGLVNLRGQVVLTVDLRRRLGRTSWTRSTGMPQSRSPSVKVTSLVLIAHLPGGRRRRPPGR